MKGEQRMSLDGIRIGFCMTGSFCTCEKAFAAAERLVQQGAKLVPIMSFNAASISTRFGTAEENIKRLETIAGRKVIRTLHLKHGSKACSWLDGHSSHHGGKKPPEKCSSRGHRHIDK